MKSALTTTTIVGLLALAAATPHPECDPCAEVDTADLDALEIGGKYLCCDLTCEYDPQPGCGVFGLPLVCKACYFGDGTPSYDDPPVDGTEAPATEESATQPPTMTEEGVPETASPVVVEEGVPETQPPSEVEEGVPETITPSPVTPTPSPMAGAEGRPDTPAPLISTPAAPTPVDTPAPVDIISEDPLCDLCAPVESILSQEDQDALEAMGEMLVCDTACLLESLSGCGAFGLNEVCRSVYVIETPAPTVSGLRGSSTPSPVASGSGVGTPPPGASGAGETTPAPVPSTNGDGVGETTPAPVPSTSGDGVGETTPAPVSSTGGDGVADTTPAPVPVGGAISIGSCTEAEEAACADISPAQREALAMYGNGGKNIVCDPSCVDGISDPIHCNYFGLGQKCRGCGSCSDCTPCP